MKTTKIRLDLGECRALEFTYQSEGPLDDGVPHVCVWVQDYSDQAMVHVPMDKLDALLPWLERMREQARKEGVWLTEVGSVSTFKRNA